MIPFQHGWWLLERMGEAVRSAGLHCSSTWSVMRFYPSTELPRGVIEELLIASIALST
jgi:hypothetical protein